MTVNFSLFDDKEQAFAKISSNGELITAPIKYSEAFYISLNLSNTSFELVPSISDLNFIITGILISTSKSFGTSTNAETITIYEANTADINTNMKTIFQLDMTNNDRLVATSMNLFSSKSRSIVAIATDNTVDITFAGYYIDVENG